MRTFCASKIFLSHNPSPTILIFTTLTGSSILRHQLISASTAIIHLLMLSFPGISTPIAPATDRQEWLDSCALHKPQNLDKMATADVPSQNNDPYHNAHDFDDENSNQQQTIPCFDGRLSSGPTASLANHPVSLDESEGFSSPAEETLTSGWVEDFLIESYLKGYSDVHANPGLISANFHQLSPQATPTEGQHNSTRFQLSGSHPSAESCTVDISTMPTNRNDPEEMLNAINMKDREAGSNCDKDEEDSDKDHRNMELWQAQYGQVMRTDDEKQICLGAISLWNWRIVGEKGKDKKKKRSVCLVGRVAATMSRLHPSLQHHNSFIRTSSVCEVNLDLVKVSSGELYRLRQPSSKHLASVTSYDSTDPTKDWDFPCICSNVSEHFKGNPSDGAELSNTSNDLIVTKTFVPNINHHRYQRLSTKTKMPSVPRDVRAMRARELALGDQTRQGYRDQAKERRNLYGGYGVGFGHRSSEQESEETTPVDCASQADNILQANSVAKRMLQSMGWNEGESLGKWNNGMVEPLQVIGNADRGGIGWTSVSGREVFKSP